MSDELKKAYQEKVEAQLKEWGARVEQLKSQIGGLAADAKIKASENIENLTKKINETGEELREVQHSQESEWEKAKSKIEGTLAGIKKGMEDIISKL